MPLRIPLPLLDRLSSVNCYLLNAGDGFLLVDTGGSNARPALLSGLERAGCRPGLLTATGDLFCGDLLTSSGRPALNSLIGDQEAARASLQKLGSLRIATVYPGHGEPFPFSRLEVSSLRVKIQDEIG